MSERSYWQRRGLDRRRFLRHSAVIGAGTATMTLAACSGSNNNGGQSKPAVNATGPGAATAVLPARAAGTPPPAPATAQIGAAATAQANIKRGGTLKIGSLNPDVFDPAVTIQAGSYACGIGMIYSRLIAYDGAFNIIPDICNPPEQPDNLTYVLKLRPNVKWHNLPPANGRSFTASDGVYGLQRFVEKNPEFVYGSKLSAVDKIEAPDEQTIKVTTKNPYAPMLASLADDAILMVNRENVEKSGAAGMKQYDNLLGTGPWIRGQFASQRSAFVTRNPDYFVAGLPYIDRVEYQYFADTNTQLASFVSGQFDTFETFITGKARRDVDQLKTQLGNAIDFRQKRLATALDTVINTTKPPLNDARVRKAIHLVTDRQACLSAWGPGAALLMGPVPPFFPSYGIQEADLLKLPGYRQPKDQDIADAKKLMAAAGVTNLTLDNCPKFPSPGLSDNAIVMQQELKQIGINLGLKESDVATVLASRVKGDFDIHFAPNVAGIDPDAYVYDRFHTGASTNFSHYSNPQVDMLTEKQRATIDPAARALVLKDLAMLLLDESPHIFIATPQFWPTFRSYLKGVPDNLTAGLTQPMTTLWLDR